MSKISFSAPGGRVGLGGFSLSAERRVIKNFSDDTEKAFTAFMASAADYGLARLRYNIINYGVYKTGALFESAYKVEPPSARVRKKFKNATSSEQAKYAISGRSGRNFKNATKRSSKRSQKLLDAFNNRERLGLSDTYKNLPGRRAKITNRNVPFVPIIPTNATTAYSAIGVAIYYAIFPEEGTGTHQGKGPRPFFQDTMDEIEDVFGTELASFIEDVKVRK